MAHIRDETADVGVDEATPVSNEYKERDNAFTGKIEKLRVETTELMDVPGTLKI